MKGMVVDRWHVGDNAVLCSCGNAISSTSVDPFEDGIGADMAAWLKLSPVSVDVPRVWEALLFKKKPQARFGQRTDATGGDLCRQQLGGSEHSPNTRCCGC